MEFLYLIIKLIFALIIIFGLMIIVFQTSNKGISKINEHKYAKVIDRVQISKDSFIVILKLGEKGLVLLTAANHSEKLKELTKEEIEEIEANKENNYKEMSEVFNKLIKKVRTKEDKHEKYKKI